eukprot:TRINITY_DN38219_c0_g1_i1.p1 TRINITY_DN38219_c0_g1~~TRINITY_DN38219_c0_g1_i1.p1  ORF type:complete len:281 (+),score=62.91 TRINITY_DN38219_c0_g1_i1:72-914(+)
MADSLCVLDLAGQTIAELDSPVPSTLEELLTAVENHTGIDKFYMTLMQQGVVLSEDSPLDATEPVMLVVDHKAAFLWDSVRNPDIHQLKIDGADITCPKLRSDYVNVVTQAPLPAGMHYVEFVMHYKGDEQWCGVVPDKALGWGKKVSGHSGDFHGCFYYCGRDSNAGALVRNSVRLHTWDDETPAGESYACVEADDVLGMLIDMEARRAAFEVNGKLQGDAFDIPSGPLYLLTHVDDPRDRVELRRREVEEVPAAMLEALKKKPDVTEDTAAAAADDGR